MKLHTFAGHKIDAPDAPSGIKRPRTTSDEREFIRACVARGCTDLETTRQFFRHYGRTINPGTVKNVREDRHYQT